MKMYKRKAKSVSYGMKRSLKSVRYIVIHYTGNNKDTAKNNADYFATSNTREAGAHFFVDKNGKVARSIPMNLVAYSVGGKYSLSNGAGAYYNVASNRNTVSIELCDCVSGSNWEQMLATRKLISYIKKKCPNVTMIIRHWDVNGKTCPLPFCGRENKNWTLFKRFVSNGYSFKAIVLKKCSTLSKPKKTAKRMFLINENSKLSIEKLSGNYGKIKNKDEWILLDNIKEI